MSLEKIATIVSPGRGEIELFKENDSFILSVYNPLNPLKPDAEYEISKETASALLDAEGKTEIATILQQLRIV